MIFCLTREVSRNDFADLVCSDPELVDAEFAAIMGAEFPDHRPPVKAGCAQFVQPSWHGTLALPQRRLRWLAGVAEPAALLELHGRAPPCGFLHTHRRTSPRSTNDDMTRTTPKEARPRS